jgi:hypothetical protein
MDRRRSSRSRRRLNDRFAAEWAGSPSRKEGREEQKRKFEKGARRRQAKGIVAAMAAAP